jgi:ketosteroid isomerase-like protein
MSVTEQEAVAAANTAFYEAFETADLDAMLASWLDADDTFCVHPGGLAIRGTSAIGRSWALIMANTPYIQFFLTDVEVSVRGDVATVTCTENVLTGDDHTAGFGGSAAVATNVFVRDDDTWRLWMHHASPVLSEPDVADDDE